jgi:aspartate--ammonia ligase
MLENTAGLQRRNGDTMSLILPEQYDPHMTVRETQDAIKYIRDTFQREFGREMNLSRISAPLFVEKSSGLNDNLNGVERPVSFDVPWEPDEVIEVVQSLAKWKRMALKWYDFQPGEGLYTNMNAIRRDEELDNLHSCYVDQWDWERVIRKEDRTVETLKETVRNIFRIIKHMEHEVWYKYPRAVNRLPEEIHFVDTGELLAKYPDKTARERESLAAKEYGCIFLTRIGDKLANGKPHDGRAPDYDDWQLNGDIIFWYEPLQCGLEISSMGIRVDEKSLAEQLEKAGCPERAELPYHKMLLNHELPYTIGGGIGQSRLCMLLLGRVHVGEVQASIWPEEMRSACAAHNITLL